MVICDVAVGWSDIELFAIFENGHYMLPIRYILWVQIQKIGEIDRARVAKFPFSKNHRDLKNYKNSNKLEMPSKNKNSKLIFFYFFARPPNEQIWFWTSQRKHIYLLFSWFSLDFQFLINLKKTSPQGQAQKCL